MKTMKKTLALLLAVVLALALAMPALAEDQPTGTITVTENDTVKLDGKVLKAYKILDATFSTNDTPTDESDDAVSYTVPAAMKAFYEDYFTVTPEGGASQNVTAQAAAAHKTFDAVVADKIAGLTNAADLQAFLQAAYTYAKSNLTAIEDSATDIGKFTGLTSGYYIVADETTVDATHPAESISALMLDTVKDPNPTIVLKANIPSPDKEIVTGSGTTDNNNVGIGETVNYQVTQNIPNYAGYDNYFFILDDTMSKGLTFNNDVVVKVNVGTDHAGYLGEAFNSENFDAETGLYTLTVGTDYYVYADEYSSTNGTHFQIAFGNVKNFAVDSDVIVTYSAQVNDNAVVGENPNTNTSKIIYSNNPSKSGDGVKDDTKPGLPKSTESDVTGEGPSDYTASYTTEIQITKKDGTTHTALPGVEFTLTGTSTVTHVNTKDVYTADDNGTYYLLKDGTYTIDTPTENTYRATGQTGTADTTEGYILVDGKYIVPTNKADYDGQALYEEVKGTADKYVSTTVKYSKTTKTTTTKDETVNIKMVGTTDANGKLDFSKLGEGTYTITETGVPAGYNQAAPITFTITYTAPTDTDDNGKIIETGEETCTWAKSADGAVNADNVNYANGVFTVTIDNFKGTELPSTGGIGTKIFYTMGAVLVIGAGVVLVSRKRAGE